MYAYLTYLPLLNCDTLNLISSKNLKYGCQRNAQEGKYLRKHKIFASSSSTNLHRFNKIQARKTSFSQCIKVGRNGIIVFKGFDNSKKRLPRVGLDLMPEIVTGLGVQCLTK